MPPFWATLPAAEWHAIKREGINQGAWFNGAGYFDNPHFWVPIAEGPQGLDHWADRGNAWSAGWRVQDQGRRVAIEWVMRLRFR